jgi:RNA polymerase sigma factor (sigma-70 family)
VPDPTEQLTAAMARGDRAAVAAFYERYFGLLYRAARGATRGRRDEHFCLDVVQDAVLRIVRTVKPVGGGEGQFVAWLRLVVQSAAYDLLRREQRRAAREREGASRGPAGGPGGRADAPAESIGHEENGASLAEQLAWLRGELQRLEPGIAELIELRYEKRWTLAAIGARLGVSAGTVDGRLRRALGRVRERAREVFGEPG